VHPQLRLRPLRVDDDAELATVLALNNDAVPAVNSLTSERLLKLASMARHADVVLDESETVLGLVVVLPRDAPYGSPLYGWFSERYASYLYLDRIVVDPAVRRRGVGAFVYDQMEQRARPDGRLVCEVNLRPPNPSSQAFHAARGYVEVGRAVVPGEGAADKECQMLVKELG